MTASLNCFYGMQNCLWFFVRLKWTFEDLEFLRSFRFEFEHKIERNKRKKCYCQSVPLSSPPNNQTNFRFRSFISTIAKQKSQWQSLINTCAACSICIKNYVSDRIACFFRCLFWQKTEKKIVNTVRQTCLICAYNMRCSSRWLISIQIGACHFVQYIFIYIKHDV